MSTQYLKTSLAISAVLALGACGGGSSSDSSPETVTGQFVDTYVGGLNYACSSGKTGVTNTSGEYTCNVGDTVTFSLGGYTLGAATASSGIVTPETLYPDNDAAALNVAQLLQTLDSDPSDSIITIAEDFTDLDAVTITLEDPDFDTLIPAELDGVDVLVSEVDAQTHLDESELYALLAGNTFYGVDNNDSESNITTLSFNADLTSVTFSDSEGSGTETAYVEGDKLYIVTGVENEYHSIIEITDTYALIYDFFPAEPEGQTRLYFTEADAQAYLDSLSSSTSSIVGSWYLGDASQTDNIVTATFFDNGYYVMLQDGDSTEDPSGEDGMERGTYTWDSSTGAFTTTTITDTNGEWGLSHLIGDVTISVNGDSLLFNEGTETTVLSRVPSSSGSILGSWYAGDASQTDNIVIVTIFENGTYVTLEDDDVTADPTGQDGMERGTYTWNSSTGAFTATPLTDTNGQWGLSHVIGDATVSVNGDSLQFQDEDGTGVLNRVP